MPNRIKLIVYLQNSSQHIFVKMIFVTDAFKKSKTNLSIAYVHTFCHAHELINVIQP